MSWSHLALVHLLLTAFMTGLIWTVHVVHYPLFALVGEPYRPFQDAHMTRITRLLAIPWSLEVLTAAGLTLAAPDNRTRLLAVLGLAIALVILVLTAFRAAPVHGRFLDAFDSAGHRNLMQVNAVRTALWTGRALLALLLVW